MITLNELVKYFANTTFEYRDLYVKELESYSTKVNHYTPSYCSSLIYTISGNAMFSINGSTYEVDRETIIHAGPNMKMEIMVTSREPWKYVEIHYKALSERSNYNQNFNITIGENHKFDYMIQQLIHTEKIPGDFNKLKCKSLFIQMVEVLLKSAKIEKSNNLVNMAINYITQHYREPIAIAEIAELIGCDRRRLSNLFEKQIGMAPIQFLTKVRLKRAKELLLNTSISIQEIAEQVGYSDSFYFCRVFKKHFKLPPSKYREQNFKY